MSMKEFISLCFEVIKDKRVLIALGVFFIFTMLARYVIKYKKKPPKVKAVRTPKPKPQPKNEDEDEDEENEE